MPDQDYQVRAPAVEAVLKDLGSRIGETIPEGWGFTLLIYSHGQKGLPNEGTEGALFYISNSEREGVIAAMEEFIAKQRQGF